MRIAFFTPLNPQPSGISDYGEALLRHLAPLAERIDVFIEDYTPTAEFSAANITIRPWRQFEPDYQAGLYDGVIYQIGNNPFHVYIYDLALRIPGILILHEHNLHYLISDVTIKRNDWDGYLEEVYYNAGIGALDHARRARTGVVQPDFNGIAMNRRLLERSQAVVVHSQFMVDLLAKTGIPIPVCQIPHGVEFPVIDCAAARARLAHRTGWKLASDDPIIGIFGFLKPYKSIHQSLRAFAEVRAEFPKAKMILAGEEHPHYPLRPLVAELGLNDAVSLLGYLPQEEFVDCMAAADISLNLRWPTAGETSGSLLWALALGKPTLISEVGAFLEVPEGAAVRIPMGDQEQRWLAGWLRALLGDPALARQIGQAGHGYAAHECAWETVAQRYLEFISGIAKKSAGSVEEIPPPYARKIGERALHGCATSGEDLADYIMGFCQTSPEMSEYARTHLARLVQTIQVTPRGTEQDRILEMGCYLQITPALRSHLGYGEVRGAYFGKRGESSVRSARSITGEEFTCTVDLFDAEKDKYPYPDGFFRTILCCELIEHLHFDPMHMMAEINRILAPGGHLILSTPNLTSLRSIEAVLHGYHPALFAHYIRPAADGTIDPRHAREYAPRELGLLMEAAGFAVEGIETGNYAAISQEFEFARKVIASHGLSAEFRGEAIYCRGRKTGPVRERWPKELYYP
ncbi:MAG: glycosyltransferase [Acidobacteria bacterium]|nr:glycosyltransferase [Acidobacteriota bacterium]